MGPWTFEAWQGRKPFMWEGKRLYVGRAFMWEGVGVTVTSFQDEKGALTACSYKPDTSGRGWGSRDIARRFSITNEKILRAEKDRKTAEKISQDATALQKMLGECRLVVDIDTLVSWTPEEREAAGEWAKLAKHDAHKKRVKPAPAPAHLTDAAARAGENERQGEIRDWQERIQSAKREIETEKERIEYALKMLARLRKADAASGEGREAA